MHEVQVNCLGGLSLPRKSVVRLTDRPDMTLDAYRGRKTTMHVEKCMPFKKYENTSTPAFDKHIFKEKVYFCNTGILLKHRCSLKIQGYLEYTGVHL